MERPPQLPKIVWDEAVRTLCVDDIRISVSVLAAIVDPDKRLLWRFAQHANTVDAIPFSEEHVIWLDKEYEGEGT